MYYDGCACPKCFVSPGSKYFFSRPKVNESVAIVLLIRKVVAVKALTSLDIINI